MVGMLFMPAILDRAVLGEPARLSSGRLPAWELRKAIQRVHCTPASAHQPFLGRPA